MQFDLKKATIKVKDGDDNSLEIRVGEGSLNYNEQREMEYTTDRGKLDEVREGIETPMDVSFEFIWDFLRSETGAVNPTIEEALKGIGAASDWVSSDDDGCRPYAVDIEIAFDPDCGGKGDEVITLNHFRWESLDHNLNEGMVSASGRCNVTQADVEHNDPPA